ncbi:MAG: hypothetical protein M1826_001424 [Phylliscum demangeonii]|nr:MAG: hypothetical protein M1826_001424 [Phylliscum demangeonii]
MAGHNDPRMLYSIPNINAYHIHEGKEVCLTPSGPQTLSLLMVPTSSPFADLSTTEPQSAAPEEDYYLHLHLTPELDLPIPATTQIYHQPPSSYLIPRWDLGPDSGAFTRIEFPLVSAGPGHVSQEDIDTFETILAQCTAFLERGRHPTSTSRPHEPQPLEPLEPLPAYNPQHYAPGEGYPQVQEKGRGQQGHIVLVDEENGSVVGQLSDGFTLVEDANVQAGSKNPVEIQLPQDGSSNQIQIRTASAASMQEALHPAYQDSTIVSQAAAASRLIITTSGYLSNMLQTGASGFTQKTRASATPLTFAPATHARARQINTITQSAAGLSAKTVAQVSKYAQNLGAAMTRRGEKASSSGSSVSRRGDRPDGAGAGAGYRPGILNKSLMAFFTVADGIDTGARTLLASGSTAAATVVQHRYGADAGAIARELAGGAKNVGLVYIDAMGVSRRAVLKSVTKGMVVGRVQDGGTVVVGGADTVALSAPATAARVASAEKDERRPAHAPPDEVGFGNAAPPAYGTGVGEPLAGSLVSGGLPPASKN